MCARVVLCCSSSRIAGCVGHTSVHSDRGPRAWGSGGCARCVEQQQQQPEVVRVVLNSSSSSSVGCVGHTSVHSDRGPRAWGSGACARCVEQQQQQLGGPEVVRVVLNSSCSSSYRVTLGGRVTPSPAPRRLTACVIAGCVGHASVHCDCGPRAWGSGERARCVFHSSSSSSRIIPTLPIHARPF